MTDITLVNRANSPAAERPPIDSFLGQAARTGSQLQSTVSSRVGQLAESTALSQVAPEGNSGATLIASRPGGALLAPREATPRLPTTPPRSLPSNTSPQNQSVPPPRPMPSNTAPQNPWVNPAPGQNQPTPVQPLTGGAPGVSPVPSAGADSLLQSGFATMAQGGLPALDGLIGVARTSPDGRATIAVPVGDASQDGRALINVTYDRSTGRLSTSDPTGRDPKTYDWTSLSNLMQRLKVEAQDLSAYPNVRDALAGQGRVSAQPTGIAVDTGRSYGPANAQGVEDLRRAAEAQRRQNAATPVPAAATPAAPAPVIEPNRPSRIGGVEAARVAGTQANLEQAIANTRAFNDSSNTDVALAYPRRDSRTGQTSVEQIGPISPTQARSLLWNLDQKGELTASRDDVLRSNHVGTGRLAPNPEADLRVREANDYFSRLTPDQVAAAAQKGALTLNGQAGTVYPVGADGVVGQDPQGRPLTERNLLDRATQLNDPQRGNVTLVIPREMRIPGPHGAQMPVPAVEVHADVSPDQAGRLTAAAAGLTDRNRDGTFTPSEFDPSKFTLRMPAGERDPTGWLLRANGLSPEGLQQRHDLLNARQAGGATAATGPVIKPQEVPAPIPQTVPAPIPQTVPAPIPQTVPGPVPQTVPGAIPQTTPAAIPQTVPTVERAGAMSAETATEIAEGGARPPATEPSTEAGGVGGSAGRRPPAAAGGTQGPREAQGPAPGQPIVPGGQVGPTDPSQPIVPTQGAGPVSSPRLLTDAEKALASLSVNTFDANVNPSMRRILGDIRSGAAPIGRYDATQSDEQTATAVDRALSQAGVDVAARPQAARDLTTVAKALDVDAPTLATRLAADVAQMKELAASHGPQNPILVDSVRDPASVERGARFFEALMAQGVKVPAQTRQVEVDGVVYDVFDKAQLRQAQSINDIDGVEAPSYGVRGFDLPVVAANGQAGHMFLRLNEPLEGTPTNVRSVAFDPAAQAMRIDLDVQPASGDPRRQQVSIPVSTEQAGILANARNVDANFVEGLGARYFPPDSLNFLMQASRNNARGGEGGPGVVLPPVVLNTFGTMGEMAFVGSPAQLVTSVGRSLPFDQTVGLERGVPGLRDLDIYSGGSARTNTAQGLVAEPFGLSPEQAQGLRNVAGELRPLVDEMSQRYGLSGTARQAWQDSIFADTPDIPSIIIPSQVVAELGARTEASHPGRTFADLQEEIDQRLTESLNRNGLQDIITLHHTPTGSRPGQPDAVAPHSPGTTEPFTTEYQFAVNGQKALPVLDVLINDLKASRGIDLKTELEQAGYSYGDIRRMTLDQTMEFFRDVVRPMIDAHGPNLTGDVIVGVDTYGEKNGRVTGSDASMIRAVQALFGAENTYVVQVDTFGGNPPAEPGRNPAFQLGTDPASGQINVDRPSVNPTGPNGAIAPSAYMTRQEEFGRVFNRALGNQSPLTPAELQLRPGQGGLGGSQPGR